MNSQGEAHTRHELHKSAKGVPHSPTSPVKTLQQADSGIVGVGRAS